jgi:hypothetical protein
VLAFLNNNGYPEAINRKYSIYDADAEEWISILKLAYEWRFAEIRRLACRYLETFTLEPVRKIELYQLYELDKRLLIPAYTALVNRLEPLTINEARRLTLETAMLIATARECARGKLESGKHSPMVASVKPEAMVDIIKEVFGLSNVTPSSPSLGPIAEGRGPSAFTASPLSPTKIVTAPPPREHAMSPTPTSRTNPDSSVLTPASQQLPAATPTTASTTTVASQAEKPSGRIPNAPDAPPYLNHLNTNLTSSNGGPSTPVKSAVPPKSISDLFSPGAATNPSGTNGSTQSAAADASKSGQSAVVRPSKFLQYLIVNICPLQEMAQQTLMQPPAQEKETTKRPATPKAPTPKPETQATLTRRSTDRDPPPQPLIPTQREPAQETKTKTTSKRQALEGTTKAGRRKTANNETEDDSTEATSSGYHTDVTNSADDAGVVGNEYDDFAMDVHISGTAKNARASNNKAVVAQAASASTTGESNVLLSRLQTKSDRPLSSARLEVLWGQS